MATVAEAARLEPQARNALAQFGMPADARLDLLTFSENAVFRATFDVREPVIIRLHSIGYHIRAEIESELTWVQALGSETDIVVPDVLRTRSGETVVVATDPDFAPRYATAFADLPGAEPSGVNMVADYRVLGRTTARLHQHATGWTPPVGFQRAPWDLDGAFGDQPQWGQWRNGPNVTPPMVSLLCSAEELIRARLLDYGWSSDRFGLIHADLRLSNILMHDGVAQVIDFDDCGFSWLLYDLAGALTFIEDDPQVPQLIDSWLTGYTEVRALDDVDLAIIPTLIMMRRMVIFAWLGSRPGTPLYNEVGPRYANVTASMARTYLASGGTSVLPV